MRIRSCQLVYLLLLLCSVQVVDARVVGLLAWGGAESVASTRDAVAGEPRVAPRSISAQIGADKAPCGLQMGTRATIEWAEPAGHAATISVHTSFHRG